MSVIDPRWKGLYKIAGVAAVISELVILLGIITYFIYPYTPGKDTTESILQLLQTDPLGGLISLDIFLIHRQPVQRGRFFWSCMSPFGRWMNLLRWLRWSVGLIGAALLIPARPILELFHLSNAYSGAVTESEKSQILAAGTTLLAQFDGIGWYMNTLLGGLSLLASSFLMLRSDLFSKATAYVGIATNLVLCMFVVPSISIFMLFLCLPGYMTWYFLLARRFFQLGRATSK
jgi:hypothetical protein